MSEEIWTDERGGSVRIKPFFSNTYVDDEVAMLGKDYRIWECDGEPRLSSLGKAQKESLAARILVLVRVDTGHGIALVGVKRAELEIVLERSSEHWFLNELIQDGFFREKWVKGDLVVFPTDKLLENQKIPKRNG